MSTTFQICRCRIVEHAAPLSTPVRNAKHEFFLMSRLYLLIEDSSGHTGIGEASPLLGHSLETVSQCTEALMGLFPKIENRRFSTVTQIEEIAQLVDARLPSARFALETALLDLLAQKHAVPLWNLFASASAPLAINALLPAEHFEAAATRLFEEGVRTFKLKVGAKNNLTAELEQLQFLRDTFGEAIEIRLDANGVFPVVSLTDRLQPFVRFKPVFIEEPAPYSSDFPPRLPFPFAADESLVQESLIADILSHPDCSAVVLKPSLHGGFFGVRRLAQLARTAHRNVVVTHMFESLPGFLAAAHLAISLKPTIPCGLFPHSALGAGPFGQFFHREGPHLLPVFAPGLGIDPERFVQLLQRENS